jgi:hypothetical protein
MANSLSKMNSTVQTRLNMLNARLHDLRNETTIVVNCPYNSPMVSTTGSVRVPLRFYQAHQHLLFQINPGINGSQGQYVFCRFHSGDRYIHRMIVSWYLGRDAIDGDVQIHHRSSVTTDNSLKNLLLVTQSQNNWARGPCRSRPTTLPGCKGVHIRDGRFKVEFSPGNRMTSPKICATLGDKQVALALYNKLAVFFNGDHAWLNKHPDLTNAQTTLLDSEFKQCMERYEERKTVFAQHGGRPKKRVRN